MALTALLSCSPRLLNRGPGDPASLGLGPHSSILFPTNLNFLCTELYYCFTSTQFHLSTVKDIHLILSTGCTCYLYRCISYFDSSAWVNMQHFVNPKYACNFVKLVGAGMSLTALDRAASWRRPFQSITYSINFILGINWSHFLTIILKAYSLILSNTISMSSIY